MPLNRWVTSRAPASAAASASSYVQREWPSATTTPRATSARTPREPGIGLGRERHEAHEARAARPDGRGSQSTSTACSSSGGCAPGAPPRNGPSRCTPSMRGQPGVVRRRPPRPRRGRCASSYRSSGAVTSVGRYEVTPASSWRAPARRQPAGSAAPEVHVAEPVDLQVDEPGREQHVADGGGAARGIRRPRRRRPARPRSPPTRRSRRPGPRPPPVRPSPTRRAAQPHPQPGQADERARHPPARWRSATAAAPDRHRDLRGDEAAVLGPHDQLGVEQVGARNGTPAPRRARQEVEHLHPVRVGDVEAEPAAQDRAEHRRRGAARRAAVVARARARASSRRRSPARWGSAAVEQLERLLQEVEVVVVDVEDHDDPAGRLQQPGAQRLAVVGGTHRVGDDLGDLLGQPRRDGGRAVGRAVLDDVHLERLAERAHAVDDRRARWRRAWPLRCRQASRSRSSEFSVGTARSASLDRPERVRDPAVGYRRLHGGVTA